MFRAAVFHVKHCRLFCGAGCACTDFVGTRRAVCCFLILKMFRWNIINGICLDVNQWTLHAVSLLIFPHTKHFASRIGLTGQRF